MTARGPFETARPPRWLEAGLYALLLPRDREAITGDLLEEYREVVVPRRGVVLARLWYCRQALSLVTWAGLAQWVGLRGRRHGMPNWLDAVGFWSVRQICVRRLTRALGVSILVLVVVGLLIHVDVALGWGGRFSANGSIFSVGLAMRLTGLVLDGLFGWWAYRGDARGRDFAWAAVGPLLIGIRAPGAQILLVVSFMAALVSHYRTAELSAPLGARPSA